MHNDMSGSRSNTNTMATAAAVLGVLSLILCSIIYLSLPLGALAALLAVLSRTGKRMCRRSMAGLLCGMCGIIATVAVTLSAFHYVLTDTEARTYLEQYLRQYTGDSGFTLEELFPFIESSESDAEPDVSGSSDAPELPASQDSSEPEIPSTRPTQEEGTFL